MNKIQAKHYIKDYIPGYELMHEIGKGGNGVVYEVKDRNNKKFAIKFLSKGNWGFDEKYTRFRDEVKVVIENQKDNKGILPILDSELPDMKKNKNKQPYYIMPIAKPVYKHISNPKTKEELRELIEGIISLGKSLDKLHKMNIVHRDIKPSNIYVYEGRWVFGDFGLVDYPEKKDITKRFNPLGAKATIAPEARNNIAKSDLRSADIFSLAKTMWILITGSIFGFEGTYNKDTQGIELSQYIKFKVYIEPLEKIMESATQYLPENRMSLEEFIKDLEDYIQIIDSSSVCYTHKDLEKEMLKRRESGNGDDRVLYNYNSVLYDKEDILKELILRTYSNESEFIENGYYKEVEILKRIIYVLSLENKFLVSPIFRHTRNNSMLNIAIYVMYNKEKVKKVCNLICHTDEKNKEKIVVATMGLGADVVVRNWDIDDEKEIYEILSHIKQNLFIGRIKV